MPVDQEFGLVRFPCIDPGFGLVDVLHVFVLLTHALPLEANLTPGDEVPHCNLSSVTDGNSFKFDF